MSEHDSDDSDASHQTPFPYVPGFEVDIRQHVPPPPFGLHDYGDPPRERQVAPADWLDSVSQTEAVLRYPPWDCPDQPHQPEVRHLAITSLLRAGPSIERGAQIVVCRIQPPHEAPFNAVAKIFDPLYYPDCEEDSGFVQYFTTDPSYRADTDYSCEAAVYEQLRSAGTTEGVSTPTYYGSWTFTLPASHSAVPDIAERPVRLILIEHLDGPSLQDLGHGPQGDYNPAEHFQRFHEDYRLFVWTRILEACARIDEAGVWLQDRAPRNVILVPGPVENLPLSQQIAPRVVIIDFGQSYVFDRLPEDHWASEVRANEVRLDQRALNPIEAEWDGGYGEFCKWLPEWYNDNTMRREWLIAQFGGDKLADYRPVDHPLDPSWDSFSNRKG